LQDRNGACLCGAVRYLWRSVSNLNMSLHALPEGNQDRILFNLVTRAIDYDQKGEGMVYLDEG
jgi:hypothetical protein